MDNKYFIESKNLLFRLVSDDDFAALKKIIKMNGKPASDEYTARWLAWCKDCYQKNGFQLYAVVHKLTDEMIASAGISMQIIDDEWKPEIGYHLREDYHHQGLGKEIAVALRDYFFNNFSYDEVYSYMDYDNIASYKTAESMGMKYQHIYVTKDDKKCRVYRITRKEWEELK